MDSLYFDRNSEQFLFWNKDVPETSASGRIRSRGKSNEAGVQDNQDSFKQVLKVLPSAVLCFWSIPN